MANERLRVLEELEREIGASLQSAGGRGFARGRGSVWAGFKGGRGWRVGRGFHGGSGGGCGL